MDDFERFLNLDVKAHCVTGFHESLGQVYERQGHFDDARKEFELVARLDPDHPETAADLGRLTQKQKQFGQMAEQLKQYSDVISQIRLGDQDLSVRQAQTLFVPSSPSVSI